MFLDLIQRDWWTNADLTTDSDGVGRVRAFHGDHEATARLPDGRAVSRLVSLGDEGMTLDLSLP